MATQQLRDIKDTAMDKLRQGSEVMRSGSLRNSALIFVAGYLIWKNRFAVQRGLEALGIKTPLLTGSVVEVARSVAAKMSGKFEQGATIAERTADRLEQEASKTHAA